jgi:hypothetical protein
MSNTDIQVTEHVVHYVELYTASSGDQHRWEYCDERSIGGKGFVSTANVQPSLDSTIPSIGPMAQLMKTLARKS